MGCPYQMSLLIYLGMLKSSYQFQTLHNLGILKLSYQFQTLHNWYFILIEVLYTFDHEIGNS